jgi:hypothetical protein
MRARLTRSSADSNMAFLLAAEPVHPASAAPPFAQP